MVKITIPFVQFRTAVLTPSLIGYFWSFVEKPALNVCWPWIGGLTDRGYGAFEVPGMGQVYAHRFAYAMKVGGLKAGEQVRHDCDNPPCCNPWHLIGGTARENVKDAIARGRSSRLTQRKLTPELRDELIRIAQSGLPREEIAKRFGVRVRQVYRTLENHRL